MAQSQAVIAILVVALTLQLAVQPYSVPILNVVEAAGMGILIFAQMSALVLQESSSSFSEILRQMLVWGSTLLCVGMALALVLLAVFASSTRLRRVMGSCWSFCSKPHLGKAMTRETREMQDLTELDSGGSGAEGGGEPE
jgi:hypothetical protein